MAIPLIPFHTASGLELHGRAGEAAAYSRPDSGTGSRLFEVNIWMWKYGRTFPREFSVEDAVAMRKKRVQESRARAAATLQRRREAAWAKGSSSAE